MNMSESDSSDENVEIPEEEAANDSDVIMIEDDPEPSEDTVLTEEQKATLAEEKKIKGNDYYKNKKYPEALQLYTEAIGLCPRCAAYYSNRSATYMMMNKFEKALEDARLSTQIDPLFVKGHSREAKCHLLMGEVAAAISSYEKVLSLEPSNGSAKQELVTAQLAQKYIAQAFKSASGDDHRQVVFCMNKLIDICPECQKFRVMKAENLALMGKYQESQEIANDMLRLDSRNADAIYVRGMCLYYQDNPEKAFQHFQQVLKLAPDHHKARETYKKAKSLMQKKEEGNTAFRSGKYQSAYELYTEALAIDPQNIFTNSKLYNNKATVLCKLNRQEEALVDCNKAIELDETYVKAYMRRAKIHTDLENYEEAVRDYEKIYKMDKTRDNKRLLQEAKLELKKSKRKDYYKILGVSKSASDDEIKKAYKKRALLHHPDRHANATEEEKKEEEKKFKECGEAYTVLSDQKKKARYDSGQDLDEMGGADGFADIDPNQIFQTFFSSGGGFSSSGGGGGGFPGFTFQFG